MNGEGINKDVQIKIQEQLPKHEITYKDGIITLPNKTQYKIKIEGQDLTPEQAKSVVAILNNSGKVFEDLSHTKITHEGIVIGKEKKSDELESQNEIIIESNKTEHVAEEYDLIPKAKIEGFENLLKQIIGTAKKQFDHLSFSVEQKNNEIPLENEVSKTVPKQETSNKAVQLFRTFSQKFKEFSFKDLTNQISLKFEKLKNKHIRDLSNKEQSLLDINKLLGQLEASNKKLQIDKNGKLIVVIKEPLQLSLTKTMSTAEVVEKILKNIETKIPVITEKSTPEEILSGLKALNEIADILEKIKNVAPKHPSLKKALKNNQSSLSKSLENLNNQIKKEAFIDPISKNLAKIKEEVFTDFNNPILLMADLTILQLVDEIVEQMGKSLPSIQNWDFSSQKDNLLSEVKVLYNELNSTNINNFELAAEILQLLQKNRWTNVIVNDDKIFNEAIKEIELRNKDELIVKNPQSISQPLEHIKIEKKSKETEIVEGMSFDQIRNTFGINHTKNEKLRIEGDELSWKARGKIGQTGTKQKTIDLVQASLLKIGNTLTSEVLGLDFENCEFSDIAKALKKFELISDLWKSIQTDEKNEWIRDVIANNPPLQELEKIIANQYMAKTALKGMLDKIASEQKSILSELKLKLQNNELSLDKIMPFLEKLKTVNQILQIIENNSTAFKMDELENIQKEQWKEIKKFNGLQEIVADILKLIETPLSENKHIQGWHEANWESFEISIQIFSEIESLLSFIQSEKFTKEIETENVKKIQSSKRDALKNVEEPKEKISKMLLNVQGVVEKTLQKLGSPLNFTAKQPEEDIKKLQDAKRFLSHIKNSSWVKPYAKIYNDEENQQLENSCKQILNKIEKFEYQQRLKDELGRLFTKMDTESIQQFLFTYREFWSTEQLFNGLKERFNSTQNDQEQKNILKLCEAWLKDSFVQTKEDKEHVINILNQFNKNKYSNEIQRLQNLQENELEPHLNQNSYQAKTNNPLHYATALDLLISEKTNKKEVETLLENMSEDMLKKDAYLFSQIPVKEILIYNGAETDKNKQLAWENVNAFVNATNYTSNYALLAIITGGSREGRSKRMEFFIDLGHKCLEKGNFNAAVQILGALNSIPINRLLGKHKKSPISLNKGYRQKLNELNEICSSGSLFKNLNNKMKEYKLKFPEAPYIPLMISITKPLEQTKGQIEKLKNGKINEELPEAKYSIIKEFKEALVRISKKYEKVEPENDIKKEFELCKDENGKKQLVTRLTPESTGFSKDEKEIKEIGKIEDYVNQESFKILKK